MKRLSLLVAPVLLLGGAGCPESEPDPDLGNPADAAPAAPGGGGSSGGGGSGGPPGSGSGTGGQATGQPGPLVPLSFSFPGAEGGAEATASAGGEVRVTRLPERLGAMPKVAARAAPFPARYDEKYCSGIRAAARNSQNALLPPESQRLAREIVRRPTELLVDLPFATALVDGTLAGAAEATARTAGIPSPRLEPLPRIVVNRLEAIYGEDAQTKVLGALDEIEEDFRRALELSAAAMLTPRGLVRMPTNAADLLCDLWARRAHIVVRFDVGGMNMRAVLTGLEP